MKPQTVLAWNTSSTTIMVRWQPLVDEYYLHGIGRGYQLSYQRTDGRGSEDNTLSCDTQLDHHLSDLKKYRSYTITVRAYTSKGRGPAQEVQCSTDQDGKVVLCSAVQCSAVQCSAVQCSAVLCCAVLCCAVLCCAVLC